jgi:hypothetical protein
MAQEGSTGRCAVHPARPAVDRCPVCDRPRCAPDAGRHGPGGCGGCRATGPAPGPPAPAPLERLVRAALAALGAAVLGGPVAAQYVDAELFAYLTPLVVGAGCGAAAQAASGGTRGPDRGRGRTALGIRALAAVAAVLGVGLGFLLEQSRPPLSSAALVPALLAVAGAVLWTLPPKTRAACVPPTGRADAGRPTGGRGG